MVRDCGNPWGSPGHLRGLPEVQEALTSALPQGEEAGDGGGVTLGAQAGDKRQAVLTAF